MTDRFLHLSERMDRAKASAAALRELDGAIKATVDLYQGRLEEVTDAEPWEASKIASLAVSLKAVKLVTAHMRAIAADGVAAERDMKRLRQIEKLTPERRRAIGMALLGD